MECEHASEEGSVPSLKGFTNREDKHLDLKDVMKKQSKCGWGHTRENLGWRGDGRKLVRRQPLC